MSNDIGKKDLNDLRAQLGDAIFEARLSDAREREQLCLCIEAGLGDGKSFAEVAREVAPDAKPYSLQRWYRRWQAHGFVGLVDGRWGPDPDAVRARPLARPEVRRQLTLPCVSDAATAPAIRRPGTRGRRPTSLLKLPGSKRALVGKLEALAPREYRRYHEPFLGSGALFLALQPPRALLSDHNAEFVNAYRVVRDTPEQLIDKLACHTNTREHYYEVRAQHPDDLAPVERAARTLFLNRTCFNGLFRVNRHGLFNVPYGNQTHTTFLFPDLIWKVHHALQDAELFCEDFARCADRAEPRDFLYIDPPYAKGLRDGRNFDYQARGFGEQGQRRVAELVRALDRRGCFVMASNSDCDSTRELYRGFHIERLSIERRVGGNLKARGETWEIVVRNYETEGDTLPGL